MNYAPHLQTREECRRSATALIVLSLRSRSFLEGPPERIAQRAEKKRWSNYRSVKKTKLIGSLSLRTICSHYAQHTKSSTHMAITCPAGPAFLQSAAGRVQVTPQNRETYHHQSRVTVGHRATVPVTAARAANSETVHEFAVPGTARFMSNREAGGTRQSTRSSAREARSYPMNYCALLVIGILTSLADSVNEVLFNRSFG